MNLLHARQPRRSPAAAVLAPLIAVATFFAAAHFIDARTPPEVEVLPNKLREFDRVPGRFNVALLGSSHVYHQINPATFDRVCEAHGIHTRSFNLGVPGWGAFQLSYVEREVLHSRQPVEYLIIDPEVVDTLIYERNVRVRRTITWHDLPTTLLLARGLLATKDDPNDPGKRLRLAGFHALPFVYNFTGFGLLQTPLQQWLDGITPTELDSQRALSNGRAADGFLNYTTMVEDAAPAMREELLAAQAEMFSPKGLATHEERVAAIRAVGAIKGDPLRVTSVGLGDLQRQADEHGVRAIFITGPIKGVNAELYRAHHAGIIREFIPFNKPSEYPELYATENQFDARHLNAQGAEIYTRLVAEKFVAAVLSQGRGPAE